MVRRIFLVQRPPVHYKIPPCRAGHVSLPATLPVTS